MGAAGGAECAEPAAARSGCHGRRRNLSDPTSGKMEENPYQSPKTCVEGAKPSPTRKSPLRLAEVFTITAIVSFMGIMILPNPGKHVRRDPDSWLRAFESLFPKDPLMAVAYSLGIAAGVTCIALLLRVLRLMMGR